MGVGAEPHGGWVDEAPSSGDCRAIPAFRDAQAAYLPVEI
jgi:hypothetical protein